MNPILEKTAECFKSARKNIVEGMAGLYKINKEELWVGRASSFSEYVEQDCQLSKGYASKLLSVYEHYVLEGGVSKGNLSHTDPEKLYMAISLKGQPEQQLVKAQTWTRSEIKSELSVKENGEEHECVPITICAKCSRRL